MLLFRIIFIPMSEESNSMNNEEIRTSEDDYETSNHNGKSEHSSNEK